MTRVEMKDYDNVFALYSEVRHKLNLQGNFELTFRERVLPKSGPSLASFKFVAGDILTLVVTDSAVPSEPQTSELPPLDEVDVQLESDPGLVIRKRDAQFCRHGDRQQCIHCCPLEPYDEAVQNNPDHPIKFMSFHTYLRKLNKGVDKGKFTNLETLNCKISPDCPAHPPWPAGICTKCQPSAVVLRRQPYRHVDYVEFESEAAVGELVNAGGSRGLQRAGWLYGRDERYDQVPLGIRAVVSAIYEPPQKGDANGLQLLDDPSLGAVDNVAVALGLQKVGWIFTDLVAADAKTGTVQCTRTIEDGAKSALFTATEVMMAARYAAD